MYWKPTGGSNSKSLPILISSHEKENTLEDADACRVGSKPHSRLLPSTNSEEGGNLV